jgi:predicted ATPase
MDVHRAARIGAAGHGGQVLLSQTTRDLIENELPSGVTLRDLGEHRLKDLRQSKRLYQLVIAGLPSEFQPLAALDAFPNNLPIQLTSFIGRAREIEEVKRLLSSTRLLTLTGPGGSGKTRLALQVAAETIEQFQDGVFFVALAPISEPGLVASTIAQTLGVAESAGRSILDSLKDYLQTRHLLLLLDNFEQIIPAAPLLVELLSTCRQLSILVTSREALHLSGEREYPVPPLALPNLAQLPPFESLSQYAAVELFIQRAQAVKPDFTITNETAPAVAEICFRLDGLPLAIELAAARIKLLPPRAMLARLEHRLEFLTGGARDLPARQQTLRNAIAWSYDLLNEDERKLFRRMSVFVGGGTVEAVETVAGDKPTRGAVLDQLGSLLDKSLLREVEGAKGEPRFVMLEMLREFALEQLERSGEADAMRRRHAEYFLALAEEAEPKLESEEQLEWLNRLEQEHDNLRAALEWSKTAEGEGELCLRLAGAVGIFWEMRGYNSEGRERLSSILSTVTTPGRTAIRAKALARAAELAYRQSDYPATLSLAVESLTMSREVDDKQGIANALIKLGNAATEEGDYATPPALFEEALAIWRELGDKHGIARALINLGWAALRPGDYQLANARLEEALILHRELGDTRGIGFALSGLGEVALRQGDYPRAARLVEESLGLRRQVGNKWGVGVSLGTLGWVAMRQGDWKRAVTRLGESLEVRREIGDKGGSAWCLERLAEIALAQGDGEKAVRVFGAASTLRASIGSVMDPVDQPEYDAKLASLREQLGEKRFEAAWGEGTALTREQAIALAMSESSM